MTKDKFVKKDRFILKFQLGCNLKHTNLPTMLGYQNISTNYVDLLGDIG